MPSWPRPVTHLVAVLVLAASLAAPALSQDYFGQNKVRYQAFDFQVLKTEHFDIYYYPEDAKLAPEAARMAERWYARLAKALQHDLSRRQPLILYASHPAFEQTNAIYGDLGEGVGGVTEAIKRRIVVPFAGPLAETDHVIGHELVHAFQYDIVGQGRTQSLGLSTAARLPMWFMEGMAEYLTLGADDPHTAMWMRDAAQVNRLPNYNRLEDARFFPYRFGQSLWAYVTGRFGEDAVGRVLKAAGRSGDVRQALQSTLGVPADSIVMGWHRALRDWEGTLARRTEPTTKAAAPVVLARKGGGHMNLSPALSPDGRRVVFCSERGQLSIEMYLADATTGKVIRAITHSTVDAELQNLGFVSSSGEWSPDGRRFAYAIASRGRPVLSVMDAASGHIVQQQRFKDLGEIFHPTWSPDGRRIAFSALAGGVTDLWVLDLTSRTARRLTDDEQADLQPAWSPDGRTLAFVTDRFGPRADGRPWGPYRLALMDVESGAIRPLETFSTGKSINPQWTPDGHSLCFVADPDGIPDLYRLDLEDGRVTALTNLLTGVSGLTRLSPAITVARQSGQVVFSAYDGGSFSLFRLDDARLVSGVPLDSLPAMPTATRDSLPAAGAGARLAPAPGAAVADSLRPAPAVLPPAPRARAAWADSARPAVAAVDTMRFSSAPYRPHFSLDYVAQPSLGVAAGNSGVAVGGGAGLYWSDMLGDRQLATLLQIANVGGNVLNNTAAAVAYENLGSRWIWGGQVSQVPYISTGFTGLTQTGPNEVQQQELRYWEIYRDLEGSLAYPFNRFQRVEFTAGVRNISFASQLETWTYDLSTGAQLADVKQDLPDPAALNLATAGAALVYDSGVFGGTSPVLGQRYRFELDQTAGTIQMNEVLADYRRYVPLGRSLTLAARAMHYGRYGPGSDDGRLSQLFIGYPWLVRGYDDTSIGNEISAAQDSAGYTRLVEGYNQLIGTRLAVANVELRVPLLGALGLMPTPAVPPIETAFFFDAGAAWDRTEKARFLGGSRRAVTSYGVAFRANLFGFAVGEADLVHPNDRPGKSWYWELSLQPGF